MVDGLTEFVRVGMDALGQVGLKNIVIGLSGGLDSVVVTRICQLAAKDRRVHAMTIDLGRAGEAARVAEVAVCAARLGVEHTVIDGSALRVATLAAWQAEGPWSGVNTDTRLIQTLLFRAADSTASAVISTTDRSEWLLGRYTECFFGHIEPLADLYKTEVEDLARRLGVHQFVTNPLSGCEAYWYDRDVLGAGYDVIDPILHLLSVERVSPESIGERYGMIDIAWIQRIARRVQLQPLRVTTAAARAGRRTAEARVGRSGGCDLPLPRMRDGP